MENLGEIRTGVMRGGSWNGDGRWLRAASRALYRPAGRYAFLGFRLVLVRTNGE